jgi:hypothetical protein
MTQKLSYVLVLLKRDDGHNLLLIEMTHNDKNQLLKTEKSNLVRTMRFWNNIIGKQNNLKCWEQ